MAQLVSVKKIESNGGLHDKVSLNNINMSEGNPKNPVENSAIQHKEQNGIVTHPQTEPQTNGNGIKNDCSRHENNDGPKTIQHGASDDESIPIQLEPAESFWTTKADSAIKIRIGDDENTKLAPTTVIQLLENTVKVAANRIALGVKRDGKWRIWTYSEYYEEVRSAAKSFIELGLEPSHGVGIIGFNAPEWLISDLGAICAGGLAVGIYTTNSPEACHFVASDSKCNIIVVENKIQLDKILKVWDKLPHLKAIVQYTGTIEEKRPNVYDWNEFLQAGKNISEATLQDTINGLKPNKCCTLIYTSGTTGNPKGVMLSHDNMTWTAKMACKHVNAGQKGEEHIVSYLPLSHIAAQVSWYPKNWRLLKGSRYVDDCT
ncbi:long-chain-fatty-acid--CoA ligase ACSBG2-like [Actinia tenebrosa]|uniref:long-chain-fatty-acid--CoA ligase n=1 Tax=Actinia tenebrosa TaxID=6105 RepID=A0A6P8J158_ACTTE|nr:long-chain-fatty-acid--CoA ligase ACSBG2-like [Actinia tenebrosa]